MSAQSGILVIMKSITLLLLSVFFLSRGCKEEFPAVHGDQFLLKVHETYDAGDFELLLTEISDSRCPKDVNCVWEGAAVASLLVKPSAGQGSLQLCLGGCRQPSDPDPQTDTLLAGGHRYLITLLEVNPYPGTSQKGQDKKALFKLESLP